MRISRFSQLVLCVVVLLASFAPALLCGQGNLGAVRGDVQDAQHAMVPGVRLSLKSEQTGVVVTSTSNSSGQYAFLDLAPGTYTLTSEAAGFSTSVQQHIAVNVGTTVPITISLSPGNVQETVTVAADTASVQTETSDISTVITPEEIRDLPVSLQGDSRNPMNFVVLTPGVEGSEPGATPDYRLHFSGSMTASEEVYMDGVPLMNPNYTGDMSYDHPPMDAISQFKVIAANQGAQYGFSSGVVSFQFKSGTNAFHGSAFDFLQNDALNAAGFVTDRLGQKKAPLKQNEYGGTFGGPVRLPKLYNGHDRTFFFVDYTGFKYRPSANNATLTTIPNAYRTGDFSQALGAQLTDANGNPILDPANRPVYTGEIYNPLSSHTVTGPDGKTYQVRDPFPDNKIPTGTPGLSSVAQKVIQYFPTASTDALFDNLYRLQSSKIDEYRVVVKIDEHITDKHWISGSYLFGGYLNTNNGGLNELDSNAVNSPTKNVRVNYTYAHSATLVNSLNSGFTRLNTITGPSQPGSGLGPLGITGLPELSADSPFPLIAMGTLTNSIGSTTGGASTTVANRYYVGDNLSLLRGHHTWNIGVESRRLDLNNSGIASGQFSFEPTQTALNGVGFAGGKAVSLPGSTGNPIASFLFGAVDYSHFDYPIAQYYRWYQGGVYGQDDWRVSQRLTLNLGMRYDVQVPRTEKYGNVSSMDPTLPNPSAGGVLGAYTFYGSGAGRNGRARIGDIYWKDFQPRLGFAYSPYSDNRTAIRGGFAVIRPVGNDNLEGFFTGGYNFGFAGAANLNHPGDYVGDPAYYWDKPFPSSSVTPPNSDLSPGILTGNDAPVLMNHDVGIPPTELYWTTQLQQEIGHGMVASIGYVGMHSYHVGIWTKPNEVNPAAATATYSSAAAAADLPLNVFLSLPITDPRVTAAGIQTPWTGFAPLFGAGATAGQALRPFPQYGDVDHPLTPIGSISYNALQSSLQKRFSHGLTFLLSYTFSKTIGDADSNFGPSAGGENAIYAGSFAQDYYNFKANRSVTSSDVPHVVSLSYTYELPVGRGKPFLNHGGVTNEVVGGWSFSGIHQYQSGHPIHIEYDALGASNPFFAAGDGYSFRPNINPGVPFKNPQYNRFCSGPITGTGRQPCQFYINPAAFSEPAAGTFGDAPNFISALRVPFYLNEDLSLSKRFQIYRESDLQFQANFFNAFNRTIFSSGGNAQTFIINGAPPNLSSSSLAQSNTVFGIMAAQQNSPRIIQFGLRLEF